MGRVYLATDTVLRREVALKVLLPERTSGEGPARFAREASLAAMVTHPNIVAVYDYGTVDGAPFIAMEYVEGETLAPHLGDKSVPLTKRLAWLVDVGRALAAAHEKGLVHRDVKPSNIMVTRAGLVKVLDFGLAKQTQPSSGPRAFQTLEGRVLGTPRYMAPEQLAGGAVTPQTDQYGLGVVAYELITGSHPNGADGRVSPPKLLTEVDPSLPFRLAVAVARALAKNPADRFPSMHELTAELERALTDLASGRGEDTSPFGTAAVHGPRALQTLPVGVAPAVVVTSAGPSTTLPVGNAAMAPARTLPVVSGPAMAPVIASMPSPGGRVSPGRTLPSPGTKPVAPDGTLRSAVGDDGRALGLSIDETVRRAEAARDAAVERAAVERVPPSVVVVAPPRSSLRTWSKAMWLTVVVVGIGGVVAGALLAAWAIGGSPGPTPAPSAAPSASSSASPNVVF